MLATLGRSWVSHGCPGPLLGKLCAILGRSWNLSWRSWAALGAYLCGDGPLLGPTFADRGRSWSLCGRSGAKTSKDIATLKTCLFLRQERDVRLGGRSWGALRAYVDGLGLLLGPLLAVLGRSWGPCGQSGAAHGTYVGGLGSLLGPMWTVLKTISAKSSPNPNGKATWPMDLNRKVALAPAGRRSGQ